MEHATEEADHARAARGAPDRELTERLRSLLHALRAARQGDFSVRLPAHADGDGIFGEVALAFNSLIEENQRLVYEIDRVSRTAALEGDLTAQASLGPVTGSWAATVESLNALINSAAYTTTEATRILRLVADGELSQEMPIHVDGHPIKGDSLQLGTALNAVVRRLRAVSTGVARVLGEIGTDGKLGAQVDVEDLSGTWKELTHHVNVMASNLTSQVRGIAKVVTAVAEGDLSPQCIVASKGEIAVLAEIINSMTATLRMFAAQVTTVAREVGIEGRLGGQALVPGVSGTWKELVDNVNALAATRTNQMRDIALVATAVADGNLSKTITVEARGEVLGLKNTLNGMVEQLRTFAAEVTRVAREVGTDGELGGQARVPGVSGTWKDLTDSVNTMASHLTDQVRGISGIVTAVANGDLTKKLALVAKGEIAALADTINNMTETLRTFAEQVTSVAREVGIEGKLGGQAKVPGAAGTWRDLTDNVNQLAAKLTTQVRAIAEVATAVTQGDLSRTISVEASGEVLSLKDTINQMIANLKDTILTNKEQDWLKTNLAKFFGLMQGQRNLQSLTDALLFELTPAVDAQQAAFYLIEEAEQPTLKLTSTYAVAEPTRIAGRLALGGGLVGQCAREGKPIVLTEVPEDHIPITTGLGGSAPRNIAIFPVPFEGRVLGVIELAAFYEFTPIQISFIEQLMLNVGLAINLIGASMRTEELLQQLQGSNVELDNRRGELEEKAQLLEVRNREIAEASASLAAKAEELARVSQYKSQFLANMSHEIRTPLNSMMILAQMLAMNEDKNLTAPQQEWAATICAGGRDLIALINQILDLSKVEAGRIETHVETYPIEAVREFAERTFRPVAMQKQLDFSVEIGVTAPATLTTDRQLLEQVLKNLLSNAFKFTSHGGVSLRADQIPAGPHFRSERLRRAPGVIAFSVADTGTGIPSEKIESIFEAFQQADVSITRKFGGTGLGLTISREFTRILGGEIEARSTVGTGSRFTLYLPVQTAEPTLRYEEGAAMTEVPAGEAATAEPTPEEPGRLAGKKVLVVEDDVRSIYAITSLLERYKVEVLPASNAQEAYACLEQNPDVALIIMDVMMPGVDGYQATRTIRSLPAFSTVPIIAHTAKAAESDLRQCAAAGCTDYVVKPADNRQLLSVIVRNLRTEVDWRPPTED
jgi:signal transduction histidine kinase/HAMP domain-containing protein/ActR/RegA family two-component response regulator